MATTVVQLSDPHLLSREDGLCCGVPTWRPFRAVLADVGRRFPDLDCLVLTGDIAHDEARATYEKLSGTLAPWRDRCRVIPGNHDNPEAMRRAFADRIPAPDGPLTFSIGIDGWRIIGLDTHLAGEVRGRIEKAQLEWLRGEIERNRDAPALVFLHHPPLAVGCHWIDELSLLDPEPFLGLVRASPAVRGVACGHVHQVHEDWIGEADFFSAPSTAFQFAPSGDAKFDDLPPGYRVFRLEGARFESEVIRLPALDYPPLDPSKTAST